MRSITSRIARLRPRSRTAPRFPRATARSPLARSTCCSELPQREQDADGVERLFEEVVGAGVAWLRPPLDRGRGRDHHHDAWGSSCRNRRQRLDPVHPLHLDVEERRAAGGSPDTTLSASAPLAEVWTSSPRTEDLLQGSRMALLVVDDEDAPPHAPPPAIAHQTARRPPTSAIAGSTCTRTPAAEVRPRDVPGAMRFNTASGSGMPRMSSSRTVQRAVPGFAMVSGPAMRDRLLRAHHAGERTSASAGMRRVSSRACTAIARQELHSQ